MTSEQDTAAEPIQLPVAPGGVRDAALGELETLKALVEGLSLQDWEKPSAAQGWNIGHVVAHLNLAFGVYSQLLGAVTKGSGSGSAWKALSRLTKQAVPALSPAFNAINRAIPRFMDEIMEPETLKGQFAASARHLRERIEAVGPEDYTRPVYYMGAPWPVSFFLAAMVNEMAIHGWDMASPLDPQAHLSDAARTVLPWFYWSGTPFMLRNDEAGTKQARLADPVAEMWWTQEGKEARQGTGEAPTTPDVTITGESGTFVLVLSGRIPVEDALRTTSLQLSGKETLGKKFLGSWKLV